MDLKTEYKKLLVSKILTNRFDDTDLTHNETVLIEESFKLFSEKLEDIKILNDEIKRLKIELANLKASLDDTDY